jgi:hypothetical protein
MWLEYAHRPLQHSRKRQLSLRILGSIPDVRDFLESHHFKFWTYDLPLTNHMVYVFLLKIYMVHFNDSWVRCHPITMKKRCSYNPLSGLSPKRRRRHFVAYEWQWTSPGDRRRWFFIHWFLEQLVRSIVHHIQLKNHHGKSFSFCKNEYCKKTDDHVMYFTFFDYIC